MRGLRRRKDTHSVADIILFILALHVQRKRRHYETRVMRPAERVTLRAVRLHLQLFKRNTDCTPTHRVSEYENALSHLLSRANEIIRGFGKENNSRLMARSSLSLSFFLARAMYHSVANHHAHPSHFGSGQWRVSREKR